MERNHWYLYGSAKRWGGKPSYRLTNKAVLVMSLPTRIECVIKLFYMKKYICSRCGNKVELEDESLPEDAMVCNTCFSIIVKSASVEEYHENIKPLKDPFSQFKGNMNCSKCKGAGSYMYDEIHGKICELCCTHPEGFSQLDPEMFGASAKDYSYCKTGCGARKNKKTGAILDQ